MRTFSSAQSQTASGKLISSSVRATANTRSAALHLLQSSTQSRIRHLPKAPEMEVVRYARLIV